MENKDIVMMGISEDILKDIESRYEDIPFGNSRFQDERLIVDNEYTDTRAYRAALMSLHGRIESAKDMIFELKKENIDIEELQWKMEQDKYSSFDKRRFALRIERKIEQRKVSEKLFKDCMIEIDTFYKALSKLPRYTREEFEREERKYYELRLKTQFIGKISHTSGEFESLAALGIYDVDTEEVVSQLKDRNRLKSKIGYDANIEHLASIKTNK